MRKARRTTAQWSALHQATINLLAAGMFHLLEQQLAKITYDRKLLDNPPDPRNANLGPKGGELLPCYKKHFDLDLTTLPQWKLIDQLRLVAGAVKTCRRR